MAELVRVRIKTGNRVRLKNMGRSLAESSSNVEILEGEPTRRGDGSLLPETYESGRPLKPQVSVAEAAAKKQASAPAASKAEEATE